MSAWADKSETIDALSASLVKALGEMSDLAKTQTANAGQYSYRYATLADALAMARPILASHGLTITQTAETDDRDAIVWTTILHSSGQYVTTRPTRLPAGKTAQNTGSSITYARRYALMAVLGLATEDDDGASAGTRSSEAARSPREQRRQSSGTTQAKQSAQARSDDEATIRQLIATLSKPEQVKLKADFTEEFGVTLSDLPVDQHAEALAFVQDILDAYSAQDAAWVEQAQS